MFNIYGIYHYGLPVYVGCTKRSLKKRWLVHSVRKVYPNAKIELLTVAKNEQVANEAEHLYIKLLDTHSSEFGLNMINNGRCGVKGIQFSDKYKAKLSKSLLDYNRNNDKKSYSAETLRKMSEAKKGMYFGEDNPMYGKTHSTDVRKRISDKMKHSCWENASDIVRMYEDGIHQHKIAEMFGCRSRTPIRNVIKAYKNGDIDISK